MGGDRDVVFYGGRGGGRAGARGPCLGNLFVGGIFIEGTITACAVSAPSSAFSTVENAEEGAEETSIIVIDRARPHRRQS